MTQFAYTDRFVNRHLGLSKEDESAMLKAIGVDSMETLIAETIPAQIRSNKALKVGAALSEYELHQELRAIGAKNKEFKNYIGLGYHPTITPPAILRNIFENPGWYTQYTPYQAEISQGRLEALLNFQTVVSDLTGMPIANASLLDEGTAAAEGMIMTFNAKNKRNKGQSINKFFVDKGVLPQTIDVVKTRAKYLEIEVIVGDWADTDIDISYFGVLLQYPTLNGAVEDYTAFANTLKEKEIFITVAADLLSLALLTPPGEWGADIVVGNTQRFGVPMGYGGPHAAFFATLEDFKRQLPGRIIGLSEDVDGQPALRMALQTREQHIKREKATSNICTAQALLAVMAGMYAVYHGADGIKAIAERIHLMTIHVEKGLKLLDLNISNKNYFDTLFIELSEELCAKVQKEALSRGINFGYTANGLRIAINEVASESDLDEIIDVFRTAFEAKGVQIPTNGIHSRIQTELQRKSAYMEHAVFSAHQTESKLMRYIKRLENKDLSLVHSMIPLGSCTMKLNAAAQLMPVSWSCFSSLHPFAPLDQTAGYQQVFDQLERDLSEITGFAACSLQPNSGAQGEYAGLLSIRSYHDSRGDHHRNITVIPSSAHGTNPASAVMCGMKVVVTKCDDKGNIDVDDLRAKVELHKDNLAALMVTYPSTHGVFEEEIMTICDMIHDNGGLVYMDGANMNAQVGLTSPGMIHADVCHLNLHKTFAIPHGGGGPGMGPICVNEKLAPHLPSTKNGGEHNGYTVSAAPWGSASILLISYAYIRLLGPDGLKRATEVAILNANYIKQRMEGHYDVLYTGKNGRAAHELILDLRDYKAEASAEDVAKRLMDYGFHAPTLSFPVAGTVMIEPTESEDKEELDRFCDAMISVKKEIEEIAANKYDIEDNVLRNAPHTLAMITADEWALPYSRAKAAYPLAYIRENKFWASVRRVNNAYGDRNLICTCAPISDYEEQATV